MKKVITLAINTFREAIRNKVLYSLVGFAVVVIIAALAFGALSVHEEVRLTTDLGVSSISLFLVAIAIFSGVNLLYKEIERKTTYLLIPKPIYRFQFILGKYLGLVFTLLILLVVMDLVLVVVLRFQGAPIRQDILKISLLVFGEAIVITSVAVLFSSFSTPFLSGLFSIGVFLIGRSAVDIQRVSERVENRSLGMLLGGVSRVVPDLRFFFASGSEYQGSYVSLHGTFVDWPYVAWAGIYAVLYAAATLILAMVLFSRRDLI